MENMYCNQVSKHGKRDDNESIICTTCLGEWHKQDGNNLWITSYATEHKKQIIVPSLQSLSFHTITIWNLFYINQYKD